MVPEGWKSEALGSLFEFKNGFNAEKEQYGKGYKFVNVMDVFGNYILTEAKIIGRVQMPDKQLEGFKLKFGDVLFNRTSETFHEIAMAAVYMDYETATFGGFVIRGRPTTEDILPFYSVYAFQDTKFRNQVIKLGQGAVRANIGQKDLSKVTLFVPPLHEQKKIAQILSTWDKAITTTEQLLANSQQQKKALMQQLLTGKKRLLDESGARFKNDWKPIPLKSMGKIVSGGTPDTSNKEFWDGGVKWLTPTDVTALKSRYVLNTKRTISELGVSNSSATMLPKGSLMVCTRATIGALAISTSDICTNQGFKNLVPNKNFDVEFIYYLLSFFPNEMISKASGSTFLELSKKDFEKIELSCPTLDEQQKIATVLSVADKEIDTLKQKLSQLNQEKKALMQQLLTGKRRVKTDKDSN